MVESPTSFESVLACDHGDAFEPPHLAWHARAEQLADWAWDRLVCRDDVWGGYGSNGTVTCPPKASRGINRLTKQILLQHFQTTRRDHVIGLHLASVGPEATAKSIAADIDKHGAVGDAEANLKAALIWHQHALDLGFHPLLTDSNGAGGFHLRLLFCQPIPLDLAYRFSRWLFCDCVELGLPDLEVFPKQSRLSSPGKQGEYGSWLRVPGRHHTRDHWSRVWDGERWLEGHDAIDFIVAIEGDDPALIPEAARAFESQGRPTQLGASDPAKLERARAYLHKIPGAISGQNGHKTTFVAALKVVRGFDLTDAEAKTVLGEWNRTCRPPWSDKELDHKIADAQNGTGERGHLLRENLGGKSDDQASSPAPLPWPAPIPLGEPPAAPAFPLGILPKQLRDLVEQVALAMNCPHDFVGVPLLALAGGAIANSRRLLVKAAYEEPGLLYLAIVARPGSGKSPALSLLRKPFDRVEQRWRLDWERAMEGWRNTDKRKRGPRPILKRCIVGDSTTESLGLLLTENPRGLVMFRDELSGFVGAMNQYRGGKGHDRQVFLQLWGRDTIRIDRKSDHEREGAPLYVHEPFCALLGGIQPEVLGCFRGEGDRRGNPPPSDGFLDRFLIVYPAERPACGESWLEVSPEALELWQEVIERLLGMNSGNSEDCGNDTVIPFQERSGTTAVRFTPDGRAEWQRFTEAHANELNEPEFPDHLRGVWAKLRCYGARLALIIHFLRLACHEVNDEHPDGESMSRAVHLIDYFKGHLRKVYVLIDADPRISRARKVIRWIMAEPRRQFTKRDVYQGTKGSFHRVEELDPILGLLESLGCIRQSETGNRPGPGRKPSPTYEVHPQLHDHYSHNSHNPDAGEAMPS